MFSELTNIALLPIAQQYASLLERSITTRNLNLGKLLHCLLIKTALDQNIFLMNRLIYMYSIIDSLQSAENAFDDLPTKNMHTYNTILSTYAKYGLFDNALHMFDKMYQPNMVSYNLMISGLTHHGFHKQAISFFCRMQQEFDHPSMDKFTLVAVSSACANIGALHLIRQFHSMVIVTGLEVNSIMYNGLIDAYGKSGDVNAARSLFYQMPARDMFSWTSLLVGYTWANRLEEACEIFYQMPERNAISWTALISGYVQNGHGNKAIDLFRQMQEEKIPGNDFTYVSLLNACAILALNECGKQVHTQIVRNCTGSGSFNIFIYNALINMYTKCGGMKSAYALFQEMPKRDIVSWNSLVTGFAQNGDAKQSIALFERMIEEDIRPNHVTFLGVLSACSHSGLVSEGYQLLHSMEAKYDVCPSPEHYAIVIDALGRKNQFSEALELMERADCGSHKIGMWGALLGACRIHGVLDQAVRAAEALFHKEPSNGARYVMLSNIYAAAGRWEDARRIRAVMKEKGLRKEPAQSWIEVRNSQHGFVTEDKSHEHSKDIYDILAKLTFQIKEAEYLPNNALFIAPDEEGAMFSFIGG
ncbi:pentatricopeptide repeat-containing protein At2g22070-like [Aristolochia californica]|uniref:pentatricopeptide repeat-containing protein At2g22070-like n=1 Tax=Aristolochia californica TaxID=171875 RepID=UPI0035DC0964